MPEPVTRERIAELLQAAPGWCRVGLAAPTAMMRDRAARELAAIIAAQLAEPLQSVDVRQLVLPIAADSLL